MGRKGRGGEERKREEGKGKRKREGRQASQLPKHKNLTPPMVVAMGDSYFDFAKRFLLTSYNALRHTDQSAKRFRTIAISVSTVQRSLNESLKNKKSRGPQ
jgi:hypothetical protein